jgi:acyl carrier protein
MNETQDKILTTMAAVFGVAKNSLDETASIDTVETWDSLKHMDLVLALEEAFGIQFDDSEIPELISFKLIHTILESKKK